MLALLAMLLFFSMTIWRESGRGPKLFRNLSIGSAVIVIVLAGVVTLNNEREYQRLRALYPYQSIEGRLPPVKASSSREQPLAPAVEARLSKLEDDGGYWSTVRSRRLMRLHEQKVELFIKSVGFGIERVSTSPTEYGLRVHREPVPLQPGPRVALSTSPGEWKLVKPDEEPPLSRLLDRGIADFASPETLGYVKDRQHVAGFQPHQFSQVPESKVDWKVQTLDLVGILLEAEPRVYVSDKLPSMAEVGKVPTRPLDKFEAVGLTTLQEGEDLWITREGDAARMLGAIRSTGQCITCHGGQRGDLLGAFSYTLKQAKPVEIKSARSNAIIRRSADDLPPLKKPRDRLLDEQSSERPGKLYHLFQKSPGVCRWHLAHLDAGLGREAVMIRHGLRFQPFFSSRLDRSDGPPQAVHRRPRTRGEPGSYQPR